MVWALPISLATTFGIDCFLSFPLGTQMFQFSRLPPHKLCIHLWVPILQIGEFPHSEIYGSLLTYSSPQHFVVSHVLHRLLVPRHPPCALFFFTLQIIIFQNPKILFFDFCVVRICFLTYTFFTLRQVLSNFQRSIYIINIMHIFYERT